MQQPVMLALFAFVLTFSGSAAGSPILVSADATVASGAFADLNFGDEDHRGGLLSGTDGSGIFGPYRFYVLFTLPAFLPDTVISAAILQGFYSDDWDTFDDRTHSLYQAPATWSEPTITWNNQPGAVGAPLGTFNAAAATPGNFYSWDLTAAVNTAYLAQSDLFSLLFRADDEALGGPIIVNNNLEYFASREFLGGERAFRLDVQVAPIPEPATLFLLSIGLAGALAARRRERTVEQFLRPVQQILR